MKHLTKIMLTMLCIIIFAFDIKAQFQTGDVMIAVANGNTQWRKPDGTFVMNMNNTTGGYTTGMAFDKDLNLYVTDFSNSTITKYDKFGTRIGTFGSGYSTAESIVFDSSGNAIAGNLGNGLRKYSSTGTYLGSSFTGRVDFCDLQADQCTMLYTTEGSVIFRHDICANTPLSNFATGLSNAFALRIRPNGEVLVANGVDVKRFSSAGALLQTYDVSGENNWFALNLAPDNTSFWSADFGTANVYRIDIATGAVITTFNTGTGSSTVFGLGVVGEITAATFLNINLTPKHAINAINTQHCVTATVTDQNGVPKAGETVDFVLKGVNGPNSTSGVTNAAGQVQFCWIGANPGQDTVFGTLRSNQQQDTAYKTWEGNPLPVELSAFTAAVDKKDVTLNWSTSAELNNSGFDIERAVVNSNEWTRAGYIAGNGTTSEPKNYVFTDRNLASGNYSYRLKQIDFNGNFEYFNLSNEVVVGIPDAFSLSQNYPNPFNPTTKIGFELPKDGNVKLYVYDNSGKLVSTITEGFRTAGYYTVDFNAANISSGVYFYKLEYTANGQTLNKVMKMTVVK